MRPPPWEKMWDFVSRRAKMALVGMAAAALSVGPVLVVIALPAYADVVSNSYTIGNLTAPVAAVVASPANTSAGVPTEFEVGFRATAPLSVGSTVTITDSSGDDAVTGAASSVQVLDSAADCLQPAPVYAAATGTGLVVTLGGTCTIAVGDDVKIDFTGSATAYPSALTFDVVTSANSTPATSGAITVSPTPPTVTASAQGLGANSVFTISEVPVKDLSATASSLTVVATAADGGGTVSWYGGAAGYSVVYTPPGGVEAADQVTGVTLSRTVNPGDTATITLASVLTSGGSVDITAEGTNPATASTDNFKVVPGDGAGQTTSNDIAFGSSVVGLSVTASPAVAGSSATYTASFRATTTGGPGEIFLVAPGTDFSHVTGILISDLDQSWHQMASGATLAEGSATVPFAQTISAGDTVTMTLVNVINPAAGAVSDFEVSTSFDVVPVPAPTYVVSTNSGSGVIVTVSPAAVGAPATYTISNLHASTVLTGGASVITITGPAGTIFPNNATDYTIQDSTSASGSGTVVSLSGGGTEAAQLTVPQTINGGDTVSITIEDAFNPSNPGNYTMALSGNVTGSAVGPVFPDAGASYPNGALVSFSGTLYVFAGGHAFGIPTPAAAAAVEEVDHAEVNAGMGNVPATNAVPGTLVVAYNNPTIYVVGSDGLLHGFATPAQFVGDGYDPADVTTVSNLGKMGLGATAGAEGAATNALATRSSGAIVDSSGTYFVLAGGRAFGIASPSALGQVEATDRARPVVGAVGALASAPIADGTLLTIGSTVYVSYGGQLYPFKSMAQFIADGYGGTPSIAVPGTNGLDVVSSYTGS
jgi:hypothetical protein